jgi:hypothetical protein
MILIADCARGAWKRQRVNALCERRAHLLGALAGERLEQRAPARAHDVGQAALEGTLRVRGWA